MTLHILLDMLWLYNFLEPLEFPCEGSLISFRDIFLDEVHDECSRKPINLFSIASVASSGELDLVRQMSSLHFFF